MILKGSQRAGAKALADHLMNDRDNDHLSVIELRGFVSDTLDGALSEAHAISKATRCKQFMFSLSLNPPQDHVASDQDFLDAANRAEQALALSNQPRAIIIHEKEGRRHAHVVWSRIDMDEMKAINLPHFKNKLRDVSRDLFLDHGWVLPDGLATYGNKNPLNFTLAEWQQAKRQDIDPREIKQVFREVWERSDTLKSFGNALAERGYFLAKGDRRGFVAIDVHGEIYALARLIGVKSKAVKAKLGSPDDLASVADVRADIRSKVTNQLQTYMDQTKTKHQKDAQPLADTKAAMTAQHRRERQALKDGQEQRWVDETKARQERLNTGLRGLFDKLTGKNSAMQNRNQAEAMQCARRDQDQRDRLVLAQMRDRQILQAQFKKLRDKQTQDRKILARSIGQALRAHRHVKQPANAKNRDRGPSLSI